MKQQSKRLSGKKIALCVTGSIASVMSVKLSRELGRRGSDVRAYMTGAAQGVLHPNALRLATGKDPVIRLTGALEHLMTFDLVIVAPATANTIAKIAHGIADNSVTSLVLASKCPILLAPAMHMEMHRNPMTKKNLESLDKRFIIAEPVFEEGAAKMAPVEEIVDLANYALSPKDLKDKKVVVTAGPTFEPIDPVRGITNQSSGKMGIALAKEAWLRGGHVTLIYGPGGEKPPGGLKTINVVSAGDMAEAVNELGHYDIFIAAAAVSDFKTQTKNHKLDSRKGPVELRLEAAPKILSHVQKKAFKVGFKAGYKLSPDDLINKAKDLAREHGLDMVVANDISRNVLGSDENEVHIIKKKEVISTDRASKEDIAKIIIDHVVRT